MGLLLHGTCTLGFFGFNVAISGAEINRGGFFFGFNVVISGAETNTGVFLASMLWSPV